MKARATRILYVEDDTDTVEMVTFLLGMSGIEVVSVASSSEAVRLAQEDFFDLYLLDGLLPTGYSFDLCKELRKNDPSVPIVFYSALGFPTDLKRGADAGADLYLVKPYTGDLAATLKETIKKCERPLNQIHPPRRGFAESSPI
jgi:DNA-binding response OmpR family regulator